MDPIIISVFSAFAAAIWSVWTWQSERQRERELKRDENSAEYVNTFLIATQEVQRKLFRILEEDELTHLRERKMKQDEPVSQAALDILYHLSLFFGWALITFRYGPYTRDPKMIAIFAQIDEVLESRGRFAGDAFRFTLSDRLALSSVALTQLGEPSSKPVFVSSPQFKFEEDVCNDRSERARLCRRPEVRSTIEAIDRAVAGEPLAGRERLAAFQNLLVDLLAYLEDQEGFRTTYGKRGRAMVPHFKREIVTAGTGSVRILHQMVGRVRLGVPRLQEDDIFVTELESLLNSLQYIKSVRVNRYAASVVVEYLGGIPPDEFVRAVITQVEEQLQCES